MANEALKFEQLKDFLSDLVLDLEKKVPYASGLAMRRQGQRLSVSTRQSAINPESPWLGLILTLWNGRQFYELSDNRMDARALRESALGLAARAAAEASGPVLKELDPGEPLEKDFQSPCRRDPAVVPLKEKLDYARGVQSALQAA